jgi:hypothetical protein
MSDDIEARFAAKLDRQKRGIVDPIRCPHGVNLDLYYSALRSGDYTDALMQQCDECMEDEDIADAIESGDGFDSG